MSTTGPMAGWYPDPWMPNGMRWWDGYRWTGYTAWARHPAISQETSERSVLTWAKLYPVGLLVFVAVSLALLGSVISSLHNWFHAYDRWLHALSNANGTYQPTPPQFSHYFGASIYVVDLLQLPVLGLYIVFLVWIHRSSSVARSLGYPVPWSPGWSVAVWLIPVVNFWMPAQALRGLLPLSHPARARVWAGLAVYLVAGACGTVGCVLLLWGSERAVGWVLVGCSELGSAVFAYLLFRYIGIVATQHRQAVEAL